jgi:hypothetical protein
MELKLGDKHFDHVNNDELFQIRKVWGGQQHSGKKLFERVSEISFSGPP